MTRPMHRPRDEFSFLLLSDRTGQARPGVFERAVEVANLLRPEFVIQIGDLIEGYTSDPAELATMWAEIDGVLADLEPPLVRVPGNHDVSNEPMRDEWLRRFGSLHHHFVHRDVLFVILDTQDPPQDLGELLADIGGTDVIKQLHELAATDREAAQRLVESLVDWNGPMSAALSEDQLEWAEDVLAEHRDVRWTVVCMHMPIWQDPADAAYGRLRRALGERSFTMFAGHVHNYRRTVLDGRDHIRLGPTGGVWVLSGDEGNFDHVTWVTMTAGAPRIANLVLDGVLGVDGGVFRVTPRFPVLPQ